MMPQKKKKRVPFTPEAATKILEDHFANLTRGQFIKNLHRVCPELFEEEQPGPKKLYKLKGRMPATAVARNLRKKGPQPLSLHRDSQEIFVEEQPCPSNQTKVNGQKTSQRVARKPRLKALQAR